jgi:inward rectifier potassium channel
MAKTATYPRSLRSVENTGFSANSSIEGTRLINRDGQANLRKTGLPLWERISIYHSLLRLPRWKFLVLVVGVYTIINLCFAFAYFVIGVEHLTGTNANATEAEQFMEAFFFSAQSLTTVGYGRVAPIGLLANSISTLEALVGILLFALVTGIFYGRFSRPKAYILFSDNMLIAPYKGGRAVMFRLATYKNNHLTDVEAQVTLALHIDDGGKRVTKFYPVKLEISRVTSLAMNWTLVHPMDEESPLYGFSDTDFADRGMELIVNIKAFDDHFSNTVQQRSSYTFRELVVGAKFKPMYERPDGVSYTILELDKINSYDLVPLPAPDEVPEFTPNVPLTAKL